MKIRNGFVSNSSTTSFLIYGVCIEDQSVYRDTDKEEDEDCYLFECEEEFEVYTCYDDGQVYIGLSLKDCQDNETMGDFKKRIKEGLIKKYPKMVDEQFGIHEQAWRD